MLIVFVNGFASLRAWVLKQSDMMTYFSGLQIMYDYEEI